MSLREASMAAADKACGRNYVDNIEVTPITRQASSMKDVA